MRLRFAALAVAALLLVMTTMSPAAAFSFARKLLSADAATADDSFGSASCAVGDRILVGAPHDNADAYG